MILADIESHWSNVNKHFVSVKNISSKKDVNITGLSILIPQRSQFRANSEFFFFVVVGFMIGVDWCDLVRRSRLSFSNSMGVDLKRPKYLAGIGYLKLGKKWRNNMNKEESRQTWPCNCPVKFTVNGFLLQCEAIRKAVHSAFANKSKKLPGMIQLAGAHARPFGKVKARYGTVFSGQGLRSVLGKLVGGFRHFSLSSNLDQFGMFANLIYLLFK